MLTTSVFTFRGHEQHDPEHRESTADWAFAFVLGIKAHVAYWLSAKFDGDVLNVKIAYNDGSVADEVRYEPTSDLERATLAWMAIFIANWQTLAKNAYPRSRWQYDVDAEAANHAARLLGLDIWQPPQQTAANVRDCVLALAITFNLDVMVAKHHYSDIVQGLVAAQFDTTKVAVAA